MLKKISYWWTVGAPLAQRHSSLIHYTDGISDQGTTLSLTISSRKESSTYRLSCSSLTTGDGGNGDKWCCIVAFNRNGLQQFPKGTQVNRKVITSSPGCHKNRWTSLSSSRMLIWWKAFSMSAVTATGQRRKRTRISVRFERRQGPTSMQSFKDTWL